MFSTGYDSVNGEITSSSITQKTTNGDVSSIVVHGDYTF